MALFPLNLVAFPGELLNLHIFEPRYKQLVGDCIQTKTTFGIPSFALNTIEFGTEVKITDLTKVYDDGRMDIKTQAVRVFKVVEYQNPWESKLYAGGVVELLQFGDDKDFNLHEEIVDLIQDLFRWLKQENSIDLNYDMSMYQVIHKIGLKLDEEYALLAMESEKQRQIYVHEHLSRLIPMLERAEQAKEKIKLNGHFKHLDPLKF